MTKQTKWTATMCAVVLAAALGAARADDVSDDEWKDQSPEKQLGHAVDSVTYAIMRGGDLVPKAERCVRFADRLIKSKGETYEVDVNWNLEAKGTHVKSPGDTTMVASVGAIKDKCTDVAVETRMRDVRHEASEARKAYGYWFGREVAEDDLRNSLGMLADSAKACMAAVDTVLASGVAPARPVTVDDDEPIALSEIKAHYCAPLADAIKKKNDAIAAEMEALIAPYRKALKGDKLDLLLRRELWSMETFGKGCRTLHGPADFAKAKVWYEILVDDNGVLPVWTTRAYIFKGDKLSGQKERRGRGSNPPSSACP
jgi:hypothetical protein